MLCLWYLTQWPLPSKASEYRRQVAPPTLSAPPAPVPAVFRRATWRCKWPPPLRSFVRSCGRGLPCEYPGGPERRRRCGAARQRNFSGLVDACVASRVKQFCRQVIERNRFGIRIAEQRLRVACRVILKVLTITSCKALSSGISRAAVCEPASS